MIDNIGAYSQVDYDRGYQQGRADAIDELKPYVLTNADGKQFLWLTVDELNELSFAEQLKQNN